MSVVHFVKFYICEIDNIEFDLIRMYACINDSEFDYLVIYKITSSNSVLNFENLAASVHSKKFLCGTCFLHLHSHLTPSMNPTPKLC